MQQAMPLDAEIAYFEKQRSAFLKDHAGKYALIKGDRCFGFFDTNQAAYEQGVALFGADSFLIKQVLPEDLVYSI